MTAAPGADPGAADGPAGAAGLGRERLVAVALGGALGTLLRLLVAAPAVLAARGLGPGRLLVVNVLGAGLLGLLLAQRDATPPRDRRWAFLATGLLGGATTFSSMVVAAGRLGHDLGLVARESGRMTPAGLTLTAGYLGASIALGLVALTLGRRWATRRTRA